MLSFILLISLAFAADPITCKTEKYAKLNTNQDGCECVQTFTPVAGTEGVNLECECLNGQVGTSGETPVCVATDKLATCDAAKFTKRTKELTACECMDTFEPKPKANENDQLECECKSPKVIKDENGIKTCITSPQCGNYAKLNTAKTECECMNTFTPKANSNPYECECLNGQVGTTGEEGNETQICVGQSQIAVCDLTKNQINTKDLKSCQCVKTFTPEKDQDGNVKNPLNCLCNGTVVETDEEVNGIKIKVCVQTADCDKTKYQMINSDDITKCKCIPGFTQTTGSGEDNVPLECKCIGGEIGEVEVEMIPGQPKVKLPACVPTEDLATCDAAKFTKRTKELTACECMDTFEPKAKANDKDPFECECKSPKVIKDENGTKTCITSPQCGNNSKLNAAGTECECTETFKPKANSNPYECECVGEGFGIHQIKVNGTFVGRCVKPAQCKTEKHAQQKVGDIRECECQTSFVPKAGTSGESLECECQSPKMPVLVTKGNDKYYECQNPPNGVNGVFLILAFILFFLF